MKKLSLFILILLLMSLFINCKKEIIEKEIYIISAQDSIAKIKKLKLPPPAHDPYKWYSDVVFIFDSKNKVYIYQTEKEFHPDNNPDFSLNSKYPNFLNLKPEHLITFEGKDFINFIKNNDDIFGLKPNENKAFRFCYIASETDTIKNETLYEFTKFILKPRSRISYALRRTTEEENIVLKYKRSLKEFIPEEIKWSNNFLDGKFPPFTKEYNEAESKAWILRKANLTFRKNSLEVPLTL